MENWNLTEHQLRSWKPRGPSAKLKARLFPGSGGGVDIEPIAPAARWAWLAPVMGCFLALMVLSNSRVNHLGRFSANLPTDWLAAAAQDQSYAAYLSAGFHSEQNALQITPIEWTNEAGVNRQPAELPFPATNTSHRN